MSLTPHATAAVAGGPRSMALVPAGEARSRYLAVLTWAFTLFNSLRVIAYLPTLWAIQASSDASQHSLFTWLTWLGANLTMGAWLYEQSGRRVTRAVLVNACNASMCAAICAVIAHVRWA
jgi:hypothetical protein